MFLVLYFDWFQKKECHREFNSQTDLDQWLKEIAGQFFYQGKNYLENLKIYKLHANAEIPAPIFPTVQIRKVDP